VIVPEVDVRGKVDVWSTQPLTKEEAVEVLNSFQQEQARRASERTHVVHHRQEQAKTRDIPSRRAAIRPPSRRAKRSSPDHSIKFINATSDRDLQQCCDVATMTANEAGNSLVITDTQINIRRTDEIAESAIPRFPASRPSAGC